MFYLFKVICVMIDKTYNGGNINGISKAERNSGYFA